MVLVARGGLVAFVEGRVLGLVVWRLDVGSFCRGCGFPITSRGRFRFEHAVPWREGATGRWMDGWMGGDECVCVPSDGVLDAAWLVSE